MTRKKYTREAVVDAALHVFWAQGFHGTSVQDLCTATGLNRKSLYAEFGDKQGLFDAALARYTAGGLARSQAALRQQPLGLDNIRQYFASMSYEPECRGCLMTMTINERALVPAPALERVGQTLDAIEALLRANLVAAGLPSAQCDSLANFLLYAIQGITTMGKLHGDNERLGQAIEHILSVIEAAALG